MKRRCVPLRADHNLLTPDTHTLSGVRLHPVVQVRSEVAASIAGHLNDLSSRESAVRSTRRRPHAASPTRRLRFEDETETEAESRYLERQRRRAGQQGTSVLVSKPDLNLYVNGRPGTGPQGAWQVFDKQQRGQTSAGDQCDSCGTVLGSGPNLSLPVQLPAPEDRGRNLYRPHLNLRTERIRETYIGSVAPGEASRGGGDQHIAKNQTKKMTHQMDLKGSQVNLPQVVPSTDLPINPYAPSQMTPPTQPSYVAPPTSKCPSFLSPPSSAVMSQSIRLNGTKAGTNLNLNPEGRSAAVKPHRELGSGAKLRERCPGVEEGGLDLRMKHSSSSTSETTGKNSSMSAHLHTSIN
uniref:uncharacterized protein KIAA1614-like n=1 Tax=Scatophagus argus TaxID=75038 RepID=UPI001ED83AA0|nr:uncharacterized protein KIAA1614-like [Scatophagus argus]